MSPPTYAIYTYRNVIGWASGASSFGLDVRSNTAIVTNITAINSVFHGTDKDITASSDGVDEAATSITLDHSNFSTTTTSPSFATVSAAGSPTNQTALPQFVDAAADDFHPAPESPTIDAGVDDPANGTTDLGGNARVQGGSTDIGAFEFNVTAPAAPAAPAPIAPAISALKIKDKKFRAAKIGFPIVMIAGKYPTGTKASFELDKAATVTFTLKKYAKGRKAGGKCRAKTRQNAKRKACTRLVAVKGVSSVTAGAGSNTLKLTGRWRHGKLAPGRYKLAGSAKANNLTGAPASADFSIVR